MFCISFCVQGSIGSTQRPNNTDMKLGPRPSVNTPPRRDLHTPVFQTQKPSGRSQAFQGPFTYYLTGTHARVHRAPTHGDSAQRAQGTPSVPQTDRGFFQQ